MDTWLGQLVLSLGGSVGVALLAARWLVKRAEVEIDRRLRNEQEIRLEVMRKSHQVEVQGLQQIEGRLASQFGVVTSREAALYSATLAKRIEAVDQLWRQTVHLGKVLPSGITDADYLVDGEHAAFWSRPDNQTSINQAAEYTKTLQDRSVENSRLYLSDLLWEQFQGYRSFLGRVCILPGKLKNFQPWYEDDLARRLLGAVVSSAVAEKIVKARPPLILQAARRASMDAILAETRRFLSGELDSADTIKRAAKLRALVEEAGSPRAQKAKEPSEA